MHTFDMLSGLPYVVFLGKTPIGVTDTDLLNSSGAKARSFLPAKTPDDLKRSVTPTDLDLLFWLVSCTVHSVQYIVYSTQCTVHSLQYTV